MRICACFFAHRAGIFHLTMGAPVALRTLGFHLSVRAGLALCALVFPLPVRATDTHQAVFFQPAVRAGKALHAAVFHLAVGARVALCAVVFPLPVLTSLVCHHARLISSSHTPACALRLYSRCHDVQLKSPREKWWLSILGKIVSFHRNTRGGAVALPTPRRLSCWCCMTFGS